jgi:NADH dehydrogenase [ubiquinone] 1 alpha subcomplex assembly factor 7
VLVEASPILREEQHRRLSNAEPLWVKTLDAVPEGPLLLVANEFLDALPIRQLVRGRDHWGERLVTVDTAGQLGFAQGPESPALSLLVPAELRDRAPGTILEICPAAAALAATLAERLVHHPGAAWFIDYGYAGGSPGATLAAIDRHQPVGLLDRPGGADLSVYVDFAAVGDAARAAGAAVYGPVTQGEFLTTLGGGLRLEMLARNATSGQRSTLEAGYKRLIDPAEMGTLFKVLAMTSPGLPAPAGFGGLVTARC